MDPLIITATPNICWLNPQLEYPKTIPELVEEAKLCEKAGASVLHIHAENNWAKTIQAIRASSTLIVQCGMSSLQIEERREVYDEQADMISIITSHHDEAFAEVDMHVLHPREELIEYASLSKKHGVRLEFEIWHTGSIWNLNFLIEHEYINPPYITTLFFGWPGGSWTPPTVREYLYRREYMPEGSKITASIMSAEQVQLLTTAIMMGDHVRVGTEDYPFGHDGKFAHTHQLVQEIARVAEALGRPIASTAEARQILGLRVD